MFHLTPTPPLHMSVAIKKDIAVCAWFVAVPSRSGSASWPQAVGFSVFLYGLYHPQALHTWI